SLYLPPPVLDYVEDGFYSSSSLPGVKKGDLLWLLDGNGRKEGLFSVFSTYGDSAELDPVYLANALPGMGLEKAGGIDISLLASYDLKNRAFLSSLSIDFHTLLYPFLPSLGVAVENFGGTVGIYGEAGVKLSLPFSSVFYNAALLKNLSLDAGSHILLGSKGGFAISGFWNIGVSYRVLPSLSISVSYVKCRGSGSMFSLAAGGTI
ncbi:MAG: hypothetical protein ACI4S4_01080, partial [Candidatus Ornithospirochaeta sp.]